MDYLSLIPLPSDIRLKQNIQKGTQNSGTIYIKENMLRRSLDRNLSKLLKGKTLQIRFL